MSVLHVELCIAWAGRCFLSASQYIRPYNNIKPVLSYKQLKLNGSIWG